MPKVLIIGAGVAGLCAGVYARKAGFDVEIVEMNQISGGLAMSWKRQDYTFENCLHWLLGSKPGSAWHSLWKEVFDISALKFFNADDFVQMETEDGELLKIHRDVDQLEQELLRVAPEDELPIRRFVRGIRRLQNCDIPIPGKTPWQTVKQIAKTMPYFKELRYWSRLTQNEFAGQFRNPLLRHFLEADGKQGEMSAIALVFSLAWMSNQDAGYAIGGSQAVIQGIEKSFRERGGKIRFGAKVDQILAENKKATGVRLDNGEELRSDWVISAADGHATLFQWIPEEYRDSKAERPYHELPAFPSYLQISLGVRRDLGHLPGFFTRLLKTAIPIDPLTRVRELSFRVFHFDPTFSPTGKTAVTCVIPTENYSYWAELLERDPVAYENRKREIGESVMNVLDVREPGIKRDIEVIDVSTPVTVARLTGNWKGSMEGFIPTARAGFKPLPMQLSRLENFRMIGQWVMPGGGLPSGIMTARVCIQEMAKAEGLEIFRHVKAA